MTKVTRLGFLLSRYKDYLSKKATFQLRPSDLEILETGFRDLLESRALQVINPKTYKKIRRNLARDFSKAFRKTAINIESADGFGTFAIAYQTYLGAKLCNEIGHEICNTHSLSYTSLLKLYISLK
jgi:hypothetical protein